MSRASHFHTWPKAPSPRILKNLSLCLGNSQRSPTFAQNDDWFVACRNNKTINSYAVEIVSKSKVVLCRQ